MTGQRIIFITGEFLKYICSTGTLPAVSVDGLPADAQMLRIVPDFSTNQLAGPPMMGAVFQSAEWEPLPEGAEIPRLDVKYTVTAND